MGISVTFIIIYVFGGVTFLPLLLAAVLLHGYLTFPQRPSSSTPPNSITDHLRDPKDDDHDIKSSASLAGLAEKFQRGHEPDVAAGYFAVCREYVPGGINGKPPERTTPAGAIIAAESPSVYQNMYRSIFDRRQGPTLDPGKGNGKTLKRARNVFFVVLRHGHLMLYEDSEQMEVKHVISLEHHDVSIYGGENEIPEGELWIKRNAIRLARKPRIEDDTSKPFFFFSENCSDKEDFYFALLQNQEIKADVPDNPPRPQQYDPKHIIGLVQKLHSSEEQLQTRWINALIGRLFLALYKTQDIEDYIRRKITKKIARVKKPSFLSDIVLQKIDMGENAPFLTNPRLKDLTIDGDCCAEADFKYSGNFRLQIAATARIDLGARFKAREVHLVLAVVVKKLDGHALVKFKPPPSNRVWISFENMPDMQMTIESIVSSRQITYGFILRAIESRIREVFAETLVLPHWDDSPFTNTRHQNFRGGIWTDQGAKTTTTPEHTKIPDEAPEDDADADVDAAVAAPPSPRTKDERTVSMPVSANSPSFSPLSKAVAASSQQSVDGANGGASTAFHKGAEPPKALRSRPFASAANPLLSMDNANVDSKQIEKKSKQQKDATSAMMAISNRSGPTSPTITPVGSIGSLGTVPDQPTLWENSKRNSDRSPILSDSNTTTGQNPPSATGSDNSAQNSSPPTPTSTSSTRSAQDKTSVSQALQTDARSALAVEKRQSTLALGAATAAAKKWGWGILNRSADSRNLLAPDPDRAGTPNRPIGRGRPLPPPGQPLPFPDGTRTKATLAATTKRKPVAPPVLPQRWQDETKVRTVPPPPLPARRRQSTTHQEEVHDEDLLVVQAPPEPEPDSPNGDSREDFDSSVGAGLKPDDEKASSGEVTALPDKDPASEERSEFGNFQNSYLEDEEQPSSWQSAQENESTLRSTDIGRHS